MALVENKKINLNYEVKSKMEAGLELFGNEVKAIRNSKAQIDGAKIIIRGGEAFIVGMSVQPYQSSEKDKQTKNDRTRKLLLKKSEILKLATETEKGLSLLPLKIYDSHGLLKLEFGICKRKNKSDKRETLKLKEFKREKKSVM
ncbi:SsrA-binding protein [bioreactor metagenome]|uniref:SsrA-binding protein n=1 Tax=bioreactor metagenome TaxID=1076179 RepID=A0A644U9Z8_9ZZZZ|nr:SsrA-binding protein SmpB [Candidatus Elulimicrobiales bacterium]